MVGSGHFAITILFLLGFCSITAEGRVVLKHVSAPMMEREEKTILRNQIGSRPPRCEGRCSTCGHCEAIQVPANPQIKTRNGMSLSNSNMAYARGDYASNYKPMSWKCKCGTSIFNP
ncbi:hypothetical protein Ancab_026168 [Ancistrocladus abbreviatus]